MAPRLLFFPCLDPFKPELDPLDPEPDPLDPEPDPLESEPDLSTAPGSGVLAPEDRPGAEASVPPSRPDDFEPKRLLIMLSLMTSNRERS